MFDLVRSVIDKVFGKATNKDLADKFPRIIFNKPTPLDDPMAELEGSREEFEKAIEQLTEYSKSYISRGERFNKLRLAMPKAKKDGRYITPKILYAERTNTEVVVKLSKKEQVVLREDGSWHFKEIK